ncbi:phosphohydrolase [Candidatus Roizmanbacteria bacterium CG_4_10_14_0_8_um_filter_33_9]|uniref:Phosphohydrolase n=1 Tax=Candidatus Roizmanbacteria bacterium CG_4_10_14_0_8_um_filter_33_9 TaxID=1974826 RepID=A0A2M7QHY2_9BACT|nr:MAG: phosphohydrolase [Candidatus Roizmanbacteria bacterium CG_4_10_14_0_8_um_filter_33_9]
MTYDRQKYLEAVKVQPEPNICKHSLALEACMGGIFDYLQTLGQIGPNEPSKEDWLLGGLIHDIDFSGEFKIDHPKKTKEALAKYGLEIDQVVDDIIKSHAPDLTLIKPQLKAHWAIFCADSLTGLIIAVALILPSKKLQDVKLSSVLKRFLKQPKFAAGTRRDEVAMCSKPEGLNIPLEKFINICLSSMQKISQDLGF